MRRLSDAIPTAAVSFDHKELSTLSGMILCEKTLHRRSAAASIDLASFPLQPQAPLKVSAPCASVIPITASMDDFMSFRPIDTAIFA